VRKYKSDYNFVKSTGMILISPSDDPSIYDDIVGFRVAKTTIGVEGLCKYWIDEVHNLSSQFRDIFGQYPNLIGCANS